MPRPLDHRPQRCLHFLGMALLPKLFPFGTRPN
jgi:hypothetical protein